MNTHATSCVIRLAIALLDEENEACRGYLEDLEHIEPDVRTTVINGNVPGEDETLLHIAAGAAHRDAALSLIKWGAEIDGENEAGETPLARALWANRWADAEAIVLALIAGGGDLASHDRYDLTPLHHAAAHCGPKVIETMIAKGADVNALDKNEDGTSPLHKAAEGGNAAAIPLLLDAGADVGLATAAGETSLLLASMYGHGEAAKALISAGCNVGIGDAKDRTPLHFAARNGDNDIVQALASAGANLDAADDLDQTPSQILVAFGENDLLKSLAAGEPKALDEEATLAIFLTIILQNSTGSQEYVESSFIAVLHEQDTWLINRFRRFTAALERFGAAQASCGYTSRALASICQFQSHYLATTIAANFNPRDGFSVKNLDDDTVYDLGEDARVAFSRFFSRGAHAGEEEIVDEILELEMKARRLHEGDE